MLANLSLLMATVCDMVKLKLGIATTMLQQHFQHLMTPLCTNSRLKLLRILFFSKVAVYSLLHNKYTSLPLLKKKNQPPILLATSNIITPVQLILHFSLDLFIC